MSFCGSQRRKLSDPQNKKWLKIVSLFVDALFSFHVFLKKWSFIQGTNLLDASCEGRIHFLFDGPMGGNFPTGAIIRVANQPISTWALHCCEDKILLFTDSGWGWLRAVLTTYQLNLIHVNVDLCMRGLNIISELQRCKLNNPTPAQPEPNQVPQPIRNIRNNQPSDHHGHGITIRTKTQKSQTVNHPSSDHVLISRRRWLQLLGVQPLPSLSKRGCFTMFLCRTFVVPQPINLSAMWLWPSKPLRLFLLTSQV